MVLAPHETGEMHPSTRGPVAACIRHMSAFACGYMPINYILFAICLSETDGVRTGAFYSFTVHTHTHASASADGDLSSGYPRRDPAHKSCNKRMETFPTQLVVWATDAKPFQRTCPQSYTRKPTVISLNE